MNWGKNNFMKGKMHDVGFQIKQAAMPYILHGIPKRILRKLTQKHVKLIFIKFLEDFNM